MKCTNINIKSSKHVFDYLVEYTQNVENNFLNNLNYKISKNGDVYFAVYGDENYLDRDGNTWTPRTVLFDTKYLPLQEGNPVFKSSKIRLYFPDYSVDTYKKGVKYALSVNTWIGGHRVWLGCWLIDRLNVVASDGSKRYQDNNYYDMYELNIVDPYTMVYSDEWTQWRQLVCGEIPGTNNTGSILCFTLYPVVWYQDHYIMDDEYQGSQASINLSDNIGDYLGVHLDFNSNVPGFTSSLILHEYYVDLEEYLQETYDIEMKSMRYELVIKDNDNIYKFLSVNDTSSEHSFNYPDLQFENWVGWKEGIFVQSSVVAEDKNGDDILSLMSNSIPLTQDIFSHFVGSPVNLKKYNDSGNYTGETEIITRIPIESIDMNIYHINAVNKIQNNVVQLENPSNSKAGLIQPVFFRVRDLQNLIIHPAVTENISINLDAYKSKVTTFLIQIEGSIFQEYGRVGNGVIFKIIGSNLPGEVSEGTYYILNQDSELITTGKYKYES